MYHVNSIQNIEQLKDCPTFQIDRFQWTKNYRPKAFGKMALLGNDEIIISMTAMEKNPLRRYTNDQDPVYQDSALEAFVNFNPTLNNEYFNFEMYANGAILSEYGENRNRKRVSQLTSYQAFCDAKIEDDSWSIMLKIPIEMIYEVQKIDSFKKGDIIRANFFKISEDTLIEHYASYAPIVSQTPNFHLPEFFYYAVIS